MKIPKPTNEPRTTIPEGSLRPDEDRGVFMVYRSGRWEDVAPLSWSPTEVRLAVSQAARRDLMAANAPEIDALMGADAYFSWSWEGCGFGQLSFSYDRETGQISCSNECMSRENVRKLLHAFADHVADKAILDC